MRIKSCLFLLCLWVLCVPVRAQTEADWWYFGDSAGIHFTPSGPVANLDGELVTYEGCSSVSSSQGNLLFYTDGEEVYDKNHALMPNGSGLMGSWSSTQSSVVVPRPGFLNEYYIFTVDDAGGPNGFRYSKVDLALNAGNGDVVPTEKNVPLHPSVSEKLTAIAQPNGYWVLVHSSQLDSFLCFEVTSAGVNTTPVASAVGSSYNSVGWGYMKFSPNGEKLGSANGHLGNMELFDFDVNTGVLSNPISWSSSSGSQWYGLEFSPDGTKLYVNEWIPITLLQFDISSGNAATIQASEYVVHEGSGGGALQLGPDGKIYVARQNLFHLSSIEDPNASGALCSFLETSVSLNGRICRIGLPTFNQSFFSAEFTASNHCFGDQFQFLVDTVGVDSVLWNFGDPNAGAANTSTLFLPIHTFTDTGFFDVTLIAWADSLVDTTVKSLFVYPRQSLDIGPSDTLLCMGDTLSLKIDQAFSTFLWQDSSVADSFTVFADSLLYVTLFGVCDTLSDTMNVRFDQPIALNLGPDTTLCDDVSFVVNADLQVNAEWNWNTGATGLSVTVVESDTLIFSATNGCGDFSDSIIIEFIPQLDSALLPDDTVHCFDNSIFISRPINEAIDWVWPDGSEAEVFEVDTTMTVWLAASSECGFLIDTFVATFNGEIKTELGEDTTICTGDSIALFGTDSLASYVWNTGDTTDTVFTDPDGRENYIVTITKNACQKVESRFVRQDDVLCPNINCDVQYGNVFTPNGDGVNDRFQIWSDCDIFRFDMAIYNRWGQLVNYTTNVAFGWDGFINGEPAPAGVYYFVLEYKDLVVVDADRQINNGSFTLMR